MTTKKAKRALSFQSNALAVRYQSSRKWRTGKKTRKNTSLGEKEKDDMKLHADVVLNITYWAIYEGIHSAVDVARVPTTE